NDILAIVKLRLGLSDEFDELIMTYVEEIGERIRHYCNLSVIPLALHKLWSSMVIDVLRIEQPKLPGIEETNGEAENIKIGDTSVSPANSSSITNTSKKVMESIVTNYRVDLNPYRKMRW
ncbi:DNA-packaging protein, partial [Paenibacillus larvae]|uniref:DNA-packaging protein n=1 Tax=Paenibacillus larvae TaxID=1464 RepID=UPI00227F0F81